MNSHLVVVDSLQNLDASRVNIFELINSDQFDIVELYSNTENNNQIKLESTNKNTSLKNLVFATPIGHDENSDTKNMAAAYKAKVKFYAEILNSNYSESIYSNILIIIKSIDDLKALSLSCSLISEKSSFSFCNVFIYTEFISNIISLSLLIKKLLEQKNIYLFLDNIEKLKIDKLQLNEIKKIPNHIFDSQFDLNSFLIEENKKFNANKRENLITIELEQTKFKKILFVDKNFPNPNSNAASYAIIQEIKIFKELGFDITFISLNDFNLNSNDYETFRSLNIRIIRFPLAYNVNDFIAINGKFFDLFYLTRFNVAEVVIQQIKSSNPNSKIILNLADLHYLREKRCAIILDDENLLKNSLEIKKRELEIINIVDLVLTYSTDERNILIDEEKTSSFLELCPWVQEVSNSNTEFDNSTDLVFLGGFQHFPNEDGIFWFINNVMPILRSRKLGIKLNIYGYGIPEKILKYQSEDLIIKGYANSLDQVFTNTRIFVAPLRFGAGIKGKVLAAFAYGIPVIMSVVAAEAIPIKDLMNQNLIAYDEYDWAKKIENLYFDRVLWNEIANMEKILIKNNYSFIEAVQKMKVILKKIV